MKYTSIQVQGNLLSEEILQKIHDGTTEGQSAVDFELEPGTSLRNEIEYAWSRILIDWKHFSERAAKLPATDGYGTTMAKRWMENFFHALGYETFREAASLPGDNGLDYRISHTISNRDHFPVHIVGFFDPERPHKSALDIKSSGGTSRLSPHATIQEYLNVTEHNYGLISNGFTLRLVRDSGRLVKLTYIEIDLKQLLDEQKYSEFTLLYRLLHVTRFPRKKEQTESCLLEKYYLASIESGNRIRDGLSDAVKESLQALGQGFLQHANNSALREALQNGEVSTKNYYRQLLRLVYRLLFLMVTEERDLVYDPENLTDTVLRKKRIYNDYYSIARLRKLSEKKFLFEEKFSDLWKGLLETFRLFEAGGHGEPLGIGPLDGDLFSNKALNDLKDASISNALLLECIRNLNEFYDRDSKTRVAINYRSLDVEELGSVYEGLLDLHAVIENLDNSYPSQVRFSFRGGTDRKTSGSYYTRPDLVNELIKSALIPVIEERLKTAGNDKQKRIDALLQLKVCDPAAGSGHMILAAARTIGWYLARIDSGEENPPPALYRRWLREAIQHCIYGVDMNPDAVELCKLALWLEGHNSGKPLSFLDHKIRNGNSLVGVTDLHVLQAGIPDEAYKEVTGDDKAVCKELRQLNKIFLKQKQANLFEQDFVEIHSRKFSQDYHALEEIHQDDVAAVQRTRQRFEALRKDPNWYKDWTACNLWTAAFFYTYTPHSKDGAPTSQHLKNFLEASPGPETLREGIANELAEEHKFFHWPLEFPDVFEQSGFDVMLGNPPWEIVELSEKEFFSSINSEISSAETSTIRKDLIGELKWTNPDLFNFFNKRKHDTDSQRKFIQFSKRYPESSKGRIDLYPLFLENGIGAIKNTGALAMIMPSSIAMGAYNASLFSKILSNRQLKSFYDFENSKGIFPSVDSRYRFSLLTVLGDNLPENVSSVDLLFFGKELSDLTSGVKRLRLSTDELSLYCPNTSSLPIFLSSTDHYLAKKIYSKNGVLNNRKNKSNQWKASIKRMLSLSDGADLFTKSFHLNGTENDSFKWQKLYSGKAIWQYDHRYATYLNKKWQEATEGEHDDSSFKIETEYYALRDAVYKRTNPGYPQKYLVGFRDISRATDERTTIASIVPRVGCDSHCRNIYFEDSPNHMIGVFLGNLNSICFDYFARQKVIATGMGAGTMEQLPVLQPSAYSSSYIQLLFPKILELIYTSWDIKAFADDVWQEADEELKSAIRSQWEANRAATGGHTWNPPDWAEQPADPQAPDYTGCPLPPFKWDEERRALFKAELDAIYAQLYGLTTEELRYILDPQDVHGPDFPGETFRVLKDKEIRQYGEYRTRRLVLEAWERLNKTETIIPKQDTMKEFGLNEGIYSIADAVEIIKLPYQKIKRWFKELYQEGYEGLPQQDQDDVDNLRISFHGLIELVVIGTLRENKFSLQKILTARSVLKEKTNILYPFASEHIRKNMNTSGKEIVFDFTGDIVTLDGSGQYNLDFIKNFFKDIRFNMSGIAERLEPSKGKGVIVIDPKEGGGKPSIKGKSVWVETVLRFYTGPESISMIKEQYNLNENEINAALEFKN